MKSEAPAHPPPQERPKMYNHHCVHCGAPYLECPHLDDRGHCARQGRKLNSDGQWEYEGALIRDVGDAA